MPYDGVPASARREIGTGPETMTLSELTDAADVSVRTVRYYIAEGLLPPPDRSGPGSSYSRGHLNRLQLIQRLKEAYLPLKEIRRQLSGLDDAEIQAILAQGGEGVSTEGLLATPLDASLAGARDYLALMESRERYRTEAMALPFPAAPSPMTAMPPGLEDAALPPRRHARGAMEPVVKQQLPVEPRLEVERIQTQGGGQGLWRRIPLGDEAELVISDRIYGRHRDRIDWLVRWARKVFD